MIDHDRRQLEFMRDQIEAFRKGTIDLSWLISSLESLRHALQEIPEKWVERFWSKWGVLEEIYSLSIVREQPVSATEEVEIGQVLGDIEAMIASSRSRTTCGGASFRATTPSRRRSKLSTEEAALLREMFPDLLAAHHTQVWDHLRRRVFSRDDAEELYQDVFLALHT